MKNTMPNAGPYVDGNAACTHLSSVGYRRPDRLAALAVASAFALSFSGAVCAQDTDAETRLREVEAMMQRMARELDALKGQVANERGQREAAQAAAEAAVKAQEEAAAKARSDAKVQADAAAQAAAAAHDRDLAEVKGQVQETREIANNTVQRLEQQGINGRFDEGVYLEDPRGRWSMRLAGRVQLDFRGYNPDAALADTFSIRRARLGVQLALFKDFAVNVEGDFASGDATGTAVQTSQATLLYGEYQRFQGARLRFGQFKPMFGLEQTQLDLQSDFMERALTQNILDGNFINYDRGVLLHGEPLPGLYYGVSYTNGTGVNREERQSNSQDAQADSKDVTARVVYNFARLFETPNSVFHFGTSYKGGTETNSTGNPFSAPSARTEARGLIFFTPAPFNTAAGKAENIDRSMYAFEASVSHGPVRFNAEWWEAGYSGQRNAPAPIVPYTRNIHAGYISVLWLMTGETWSDFYSNGAWQKVRPLNRFSFDSGGGWGAWELGFRYSYFDASDFTASNPANTGRLGATAPVTTSTNKADAYTFQLKWIMNPFARVLLDVVTTNFYSPVTVNGITIRKEQSVMGRVQVDF